MPALDGIRGVAVLMVISHHCMILAPSSHFEWLYSQFSDLGKFGVDMFFGLSGFLITGILLDSKGQPSYFRNFYARRTLRIFPLYYAMLFLYFVVLPPIYTRVPEIMRTGIQFIHASHYWPWFMTYTANLLMVKLGQFAVRGLDVTWSLSIEEQFYLLWPTVVLLLSRKSLMRLCAATVLGAMIVRILLWHWAHFTWGQIYVFTPCRVDQIAAGAFVAAYMRAPDYKPGAIVAPARWVFAVSGSVLIALFPSKNLYHEAYGLLTIGYLFVSLFVASGLVMLLHAPRRNPVRRVFNSDLMRNLGRYSYAMYLFHVPIAEVLNLKYGMNNRSFRLMPGPAIVWMWGYILLVTIISYVLAALSWHFFESRVLALKKYFPRARGLKVVDPAEAGALEVAPASAPAGR